MRVVQECVRPVAVAGGGWEVGGEEVYTKVSFFHDATRRR